MGAGLGKPNARTRHQRAAAGGSVREWKARLQRPAKGRRGAVVEGVDKGWRWEKQAADCDVAVVRFYSGLD